MGNYAQQINSGRAAPRQSVNLRAAFFGVVAGIINPACGINLRECCILIPFPPFDVVAQHPAMFGIAETFQDTGAAGLNAG